MIQAIVTDIEGTTGSIHFVHQVLFPYASQHMADFVRQNAHQKQVSEQLDAVRMLADCPQADLAQVIEILLAWIAEDRKATPLKALQGILWEQGYQNGDFKGHVYADVVTQLEIWQQQGLALYVYSSGSIHAQKLLFAHSEAGDLTRLFSGYFDTTSGNKREIQSYQQIAQNIGLPAQDLLFLSDVVEELDAAQAAGWKTCQLVREPAMRTGKHPQVTSFAHIQLQNF